jgi:hypothetical protein
MRCHSWVNFGFLTALQFMTEATILDAWERGLTGKVGERTVGVFMAENGAVTFARYTVRIYWNSGLQMMRNCSANRPMKESWKIPEGPGAPRATCNTVLRNRMISIYENHLDGKLRIEASGVGNTASLKEALDNMHMKTTDLNPTLAIGDVYGKNLEKYDHNAMDFEQFVLDKDTKDIIDRPPVSFTRKPVEGASGSLNRC